MAIKKTVEINVETKDAEKNIDNLTGSVKDLKKESSGIDSKGVSSLGKESQGSAKSVGGLSNSFKGLGLAIKATGIGLLLGLLAGLVDGLKENERAAKFFKVATEAVSIVFQDFINFIIDNSSNVVDFFKAIFENPQQSIEDLGNLIKDNLIERFNSFLDLLGFVGEAMKKFVSGDFKGALESVKNAGKELVDVATGVDNTFDKVVNGVSNTIDAVKEYGNTVIDTASKNVQLAKSAEIAAAQQALLVEQYDRQAEKLRQIRDNDLVSIEERIQANNDLKAVLDEQEKAMLREADAILASAAAQAAKNNNTENATALLEAQANRAGVLAQIEGFRSEQESNRIALIKERLELEQSAAESEEQRQLRQKEFDAEREENEILRLEKQREILEEERLIEEERLQMKVDSYAIGTQARVDAENELKDRLQEIDNEITSNEDANKQARVKIAEEEAKAKVASTNAIKDALNTAASLLGESTAAGKAAAIAATTIDTIQSGVSAYKGMVAAIPGPVGIAAGAVASAGSLASGYASVKKILSVKTPNGGGGGGGAPSAPSQPQAPAFNLVGQSGVNQVQESIQEEQTPIQAYVVGAQVTSQQEADRNQQDSASIG